MANELTGWNGATLAYDLNGNMTSDGTNTYTWDARNQLASISGVVTAGFPYDPFGRRLGKAIGSTTTNYLYDGVNPVQELSGATVSANLLTGGVDEYFTRTDALGTSNFLSDALGSTVALAGTTGTVQTSYTYQPFGGTTAQGGSNANSYQFTARENDGDGLYFYRARYYSPMFGRFVSPDPGSFADGYNLYGYTGDCPAQFTDPSGLDGRDPSTSRRRISPYHQWRSSRPQNRAPSGETEPPRETPPVSTRPELLNPEQPNIWDTQLARILKLFSELLTGRGMGATAPFTVTPPPNINGIVNPAGPPIPQG